MIVYTKDDVIYLCGNLVKNQWLTIRAAAHLLLQEYVEGIIIDCGELEKVSDNGAQTFLDAVRDIQAAHARIFVCNLPEEILRQIRSVPGVRSQLPIANSVQEARASLRGVEMSHAADKQQVILVPVLQGFDAVEAIGMAAELGREHHLPLILVYPLEVSRNLPLGAPLPDQEALAAQMLDQAMEAARKLNLPFSRHVERVRDSKEGILLEIEKHTAAFVVVSADSSRLNDSEAMDLVHALLNRASCSVLIGRKAPAA